MVLLTLFLNSTNNGGCQPGSDTLTININPRPDADVGSDITICNTADSIALFANLTNAATGTWTSSGSGTFSPHEDSLEVYYQPSSFDLASGSFTLHFSTTGATVCNEDTDSLTVNVVTPLNLGFTNSASCANNPMQFTDTTTILSGIIDEWIWDFGDGDSSSSQNPIHAFDAEGIYDVKLFAKSSLGCEYTLTKSIEVEGAPTAAFEFSPTDPQINTEVTFTNKATDALTYEWLFGELNASSEDENPVYTYIEGGTFTVTQIVTNSLGCTDSASVSVTVREDLVYPPAVPSGFSPNGDGENDVLLVRGGLLKLSI